MIVGADDSHDLCQQCYRSERDRQRAADLARDVSGFVGGSVFTY